MLLALAVALAAATQASAGRPVPPGAVPKAPEILEGLVTDPQGKPVEGALVVVSCATARPGEPPLTARTDSQGRFRIQRAGPGPCTVRVEAAGWAPARLERVRPGPPLKLALDAGRAIEGTIRDGGTGLPVAAARVEARAQGVTPLSWEPASGTVDARSDAQGRYRLTGLGRGVYDVTASGRGYGRARKAGVVAPRRVDFALIPGASVSGSVVGPDQKGIVGVVVRLEPQDRFRSGALLARTDAAGAFEIAGVAPGVYRLACWKPGMGALLVPDVQVEGAGETRLPLTLLPATAVAGHLVDDKGRGLAGRVALEELNGTTVSPALGEVLRAEAGADGRFRLEGLPAGAHALSATAPGRAARRVAFEVGPKEAADLGDITLEVGLAIRGRVRDKSGLPVPGALVRALNWTPTAAVRAASAQTEADGTFVLAGLSEGTYQVAVSAAGYGGATLQAEPGADVDVVLSPGGAIAGLVVDEAGRPVEGFSVEAEPAGDPATSGPGGSKDVASPDGRFQLDDLDEGVFVLRVSAPEHAPAVVSGLKVVAGGTTDAGRIRLGPSGVLRGSVWDREGSPVSGATVLVFGAGERWETGSEPQATSDVAGNFEIRGVAAGTAQAVARHPDFAESVLTGLEIDPAKGPTEARFVLGRGARVEGFARARDGGAVPDAEVGVWPAAGGTISGPPTTIPLLADGSFAADHLQPGPATVTLMKASGARRISVRSETVTLQEGETTFVDLSSSEIVVSGRVTRDAVPAPRLRVSFRSSGGFVAYSSSSTPSAPSPGPQHLVGVTDENGGYELIVDSPGRYRVTVETPDGHTTYTSRSVDVPDVDAWSLDMDFAGSPVTGTVVDREDGTPIADAWIWAERKDGGRSDASARSAADGRFELLLLDGDYQLLASADGHADEAIDVGVPGASDLRIALPRGGSLKGRVVDASGHGVAGLTVQAGCAQGDLTTSRTSLTLSDGSFEFTGIPSLPWAVLAGSADAGFAFRGGLRPGDADVVLALKPGGQVRLLVRGPEGQPAANANAYLTGVGDSFVLGGGTRTDAHGLGAMAVPAGTVQIRAIRDELSGAARVSVPQGGVVDVEIVLARGRPPSP